MLVAAVRAVGSVGEPPRSRFGRSRAVARACTRSCCRLRYRMHADEMRADVASHRPMLYAGIANSGAFRHYQGEKGCGRPIDQVHLSV